MPTRVGRRLDAGGAVYNLDESEGENVSAEQPPEGFEDARIVCPDNGTWAHPEGHDPGGARSQEGSEYRDATAGAVLDRGL
eukprot:3322423-Alexandrium_andersonii.AAC.1